MNFTDKHKSLVLTGLLAGTVVMGVFNFHLNKQDVKMTESYYEVEPLTEEELLAEEEALAEAAKQNDAETNKAFNETENYKRFAEAYQPIAPPKDYEFTPSESDSENTDSNDNSTNSEPELDDDVLSSFNSVNDVLNKQKGTMSQQSVSKKSTVSYSLVNRTHKYLPIPIYLCDEGGKVVVSITVNSIGKVTDASINEAASVKNECLKGHALEYAQKARFSTENSKKTQIGSITFQFEGKN